MRERVHRSAKACASQQGWVLDVIIQKRSFIVFGFAMVLYGYFQTLSPWTTIKQHSTNHMQSFQSTIVTSDPNVLNFSLARANNDYFTANGKWIHVTQSPDIFAFSAFFDPRTNPGSVKIIAVVDSYLYVIKSLRCVLKKDPSCEEIVTGVLGRIGHGVYVNDRLFIETIITCPAENDFAIREVSVIINETESLKLNVEQMYPSSPSKEICTCVSISYGEQNSSRLIEWFEMLKILQVSDVSVYNNSIPNDKDIVKIFNHYKKSGFLTVRKSEPFLGSDYKKPHVFLHMSPVLNDCMYRNMYTCKKVMIIDFDEVIVTRKHTNLIQLLEHLDTKLNASIYVFSNVHFFTDKQPEDMVRNSTFLTYKLRLPTSPKGASVKYIMNPRTCTHAHNHICWRGVNMTSLLVPEEFATNNHYKLCHLDRYLKVNGSCKHFMKQMFVDESIQSFKDILTRRICKANSEIFD